MTVAFSAQGVSKFFPGVIALDNVNLTLRSGEIHALLGENGAGKSSLIKMITGVHRPDAGHLTMDGQNVVFHSPRDSMAAGIGVVHQERNLIPRYSVAENLFLDRLPTRMGFVRRNEVRQQARTWLDLLELQIDPDTPVAALSVAQMQLVEIGRALSTQSRILLLDEPTASIGEHESQRLFTILRRLKAQGVAVLFVSHKLEEVLALCDRVTILRDGKNVCDDAPLDGVTKAEIVSQMVGRENVVNTLGVRTPKLGVERLQLEDVATVLGHGDINLKVRAGEVVGLYGLVGAGRSELAKSILGLHKVTAGEIRINGKAVKIASPLDALRNHKLGYVSEDRKSEGLILSHPIAQNAAITIWHRLGRLAGFLTSGIEKKAVSPVIRRLDVRAPSLDQLVGNLSGGNQQKISVAKWLAAGTQILIIDEPTVGVDIRNKASLHQLIWDLSDEGVAVVVISSDLAEIIQLADRIYVLNEYQLVNELDNTRDYEGMSVRIMQAIHTAPQTSEVPGEPRTQETING